MRGDGGVDEAAADAEQWGFPEELVSAIAAKGTQGVTEVWRENWDTVCAFAAVLTQWRAVPKPRGGCHYLGLDYAGARAGLDAEAIAVTPELWCGLRTMEAEACTVLNSGG
ncbi:MAG: DUF1799 domain-containing protein [Altererythrobacter sp.]|nr:DUF1799 domain-containing protein [Altererythrobacter sp.]